MGADAEYKEGINYIQQRNIDTLTVSRLLTFASIVMFIWKKIIICFDSAFAAGINLQFYVHFPLQTLNLTHLIFYVIKGTAKGHF